MHVWNSFRINREKRSYNSMLEDRMSSNVPYPDQEKSWTDYTPLMAAESLVKGTELQKGNQLTQIDRALAFETLS